MKSQYKTIFDAILHNSIGELSLAIGKTLELSSGHILDFQDILVQQSQDTALHLASRTKHTSVLKYLLEHGFAVCVEKRNAEGKRPLHEAAQGSNFGAVQLLLQAGACIDPLNRGDWTPLMLAVTKNDPDATEVVRVLLAAGSDDTLRNKDGWTAAHVCCRSGSLEALQLLLRHRSDGCHTASNNGRTPLHTAALHGRHDLLPLLHRHGAGHPNDEDSCGSRPLMDALRGGHLETARLLTQLWTDTNPGARDVLGRTVLQVAAEAGRVDAVRFLVEEHHQDPTATDNIGQCALHSAAREGHCDLVTLLVRNLSCDVNAKDRHGRTALWCARVNRRTACERALLQLGADADGGAPGASGTHGASPNTPRHET